MGLCVSTTCTVTRYLNQNSVIRLHSTVNSPSFPSSSVVSNFVKPVKRDTSHVTSKQKKAQTTSIADIPSPVGSIVSLCMDIISRSISDQTFSKETSSYIASEVPLVQYVIQSGQPSLLCATKGRLIHSQSMCNK